ncbi:glycerophosphoryl diester phosphodiesterase [Hymenobacter daecheongensis DSM 21074]|uniref:Glycerophosphoryl diester phosphodiesterase n=1 Tax=Hymenobacter daecheongensis DSM 21074 TaxID=1121955 RepID=A0A1M6CH31_9BACT|nr:glycerophosphodiester phosphodiesterase family protein [Hymenobacter daecheongensis]SHI59998.1 glycerophosphoryl diester phosphodiesterase [Hymenobacter daecheongensis DSM 21074]
MIKRLLPLLAALLLTTAALAQSNSLRREPGQMVVVGHAGSGFFRPLNTFNPLPPSSLRSELKALQDGAEGLEVDIQLSQDSVPVLYHDVTLSSMTRTGRGCTSEQPAAALVQLRYRGGWPYDWFQRERIITFDTLLARLARRPEFPYLHLDLHEDLPCLSPVQAQASSAALARQLVRLLQRYRVPPGRVLFVTDQVATLQRVRRLWPAALQGYEITHDFAANLRKAQALNVEAVVLSEDLTTAANTAQAHAAGLAVVAFGGRSTKRITELVQANPDAYEVDNVAKLRRVLGRSR